MKYLVVVSLLFFTTACNITGAGREINLPSISPPSPKLSTASPEPPHKTPTLREQITTSPIPTREKTPSTPTRIPTPYIVEVIDWELVEAHSTTLCPDCGVSLTSIQVPRKMGIAVVRAYILGGEGSAARLVTNLLYPSPIELECKGGQETYCGMIFGQVDTSPLTVSAEYLMGDQHELVFLVTFQEWAER